MKFYQLADKQGDDFNYDRERMRNLITNLFPGRYLVSFQRIEPKSNVKDYRACYFAKIDAIRSEIGEERYTVHEFVKEYVIANMAEDVPEVFMKQEVISTRYLTLEGWSILLERLDLWAFTQYNIILR